MKKTASLQQVASKNKRVNMDQLQDALEAMNELLRLGVHQGPNYRVGVPYEIGLRKAEPNMDDTQRKLRFQLP
jgi:hypothetical protein